MGKLLQLLRFFSIALFFLFHANASINQPPVANNDSAITPVDAPVNIVVLGNDTDVDGDALTVISTTQPTNGTVTINADATVTYTPDTNFYSTDTFEYTISDGNGGTDTATVFVLVDGGPPPVASDDSAITPEDTPVVIVVLTNDTDADGDVLTVTSTTQPTYGTVTNNADGTVTYTPNANYNGTDTFTYTISNNYGGTDIATVTVTVTPVNDDPVANDDYFTIPVDSVDIHIDELLANNTDVDGDTLIVTSTTQPTYGTLSMNNGTMTYTPNVGFLGTDTFEYTISDGNGGTDTATVFVLVDGGPPPVASDDSAITPEDTPVVIVVLTNDTDADGDVLTVTSTTQPTYGTVTNNADGTVTYTPNANYNGTDTFTYTISNNYGGTDIATVTVDVISATSPDYEVSITVNKTIFINNDNDFEVLVTFTELLHGLNIGDVVLSINKNANMTLSFDSNTLTTMGGKVLSNSDWEWTETVTSYRLTYVGTSTIYPSFTRDYLGIHGTFTPPYKGKGKFPLTIKLRDASGDMNSNNNKDIEVFTYSNEN